MQEHKDRLINACEPCSKVVIKEITNTVVRLKDHTQPSDNPTVGRAYNFNRGL